MVRDQDEFGGDDPSLCLLLGQRALSRQGRNYTLTELPDRALLTGRFERTPIWGVWAGHSVAVAFLNLDQFEQINGSLGDAAGDVVLVEVAEHLALQSCAEEMLFAAAGAVNDAKRRGLGKCRSSFQSCASGWSR